MSTNLIRSDLLANTNEPDLEKASKAMEEFLRCLNLNVNHEHLKDSASRIAKMYVHELFRGLYTDPPKMTSFTRKQTYTSETCKSSDVAIGLIISDNITVKSVCAHHFVPFIGKALVAYIPNDIVVGLSKLARVVDYFARRPQVQERLTDEIVEFIFDQIKPAFVFCGVKCQHQCMICRGVKEHNSSMITYSFRVDTTKHILDVGALITMLTEKAYELRLK